MTYRFLAAFFALALAVPGTPQAQDATNAPEQTVDHQLALATALTSDSFVADSFRNSMAATFESMLQANPEIKALDSECPGIWKALGNAAEPIIWPSYRREFAQYRVDLHALLRREMSDEHAREGAAFFNSTLGRRFMSVLISQMTVDTIMSELTIDEDADISENAIEADTVETLSRGYAALEPVDRIEIGTVFTASDWGKSFARLQPRISELQSAMSKADYTPEENAAIDAAMEEAAERHFATCFPELNK